jgi:hypothetical protein
MSGVKKRKCHVLNCSPDHIHAGIKSKEARHVYVPHYDTLTIKTILDFLADGRKQVFDYLPDL